MPEKKRESNYAYFSTIILLILFMIFIGYFIRGDINSKYISNNIIGVRGIMALIGGIFIIIMSIMKRF